MAQLSCLEELRLGRNPLQAISPRLAELPRLKHLQLDDDKEFQLLPRELQARVRRRYICEMDGYLELHF